MFSYIIGSQGVVVTLYGRCDNDSTNNELGNSNECVRFQNAKTETNGDRKWEEKKLLSSIEWRGNDVDGWHMHAMRRDKRAQSK